MLLSMTCVSFYARLIHLATHKKKYNNQIRMKKAPQKIIIDSNEFVSSTELEKALYIAKSDGDSICIDKDLYNQLASKNISTSNVSILESKHDYSNTDLLISIGGDGTFLRAVSKVGGFNIPVLGVNAGRLGFLADTRLDNFAQAFHKFKKGLYTLEHRTMLEVKVDNVLMPSMPFALNEVAVMKQESASMITVETYIDGSYMSTFEADGLMVSTPTGSTAYSLSVGGPVVMADLPCFVINSIASHSLTSRPIVVSDKSLLSIRVISRTNNFLLSVDGRSLTLSQNQLLCIKKSPYTLPLVRIDGDSFISTLRHKLKWGVDPREC